MTSTLAKNSDGTVVLTLTFPWSEIQAGYEHVVQEAMASSELPGFRTGKAPRELVEPKLSKTDSLSQALQHILPSAYQQAIAQHHVQPILYPKLLITQAQEGKDWVITATTCEAPTITLPDYKKDLPKKFADLQAVLDYLLKNTQIELPTVLIDEETNHRLAGLAENLTNLGMTTQSYLASKKLTLDDLKKQFSQQAKNDLSVEFALSSIQTQEKLADRQKTLDFLQTLL